MTDHSQKTFAHRLRVRFYECDPQGAVWNANFLNYFEVASAEMMREVRGPYSQLLAEGLDVVIAETRLRYLAPARFDEELEVELDCTRLGTTSFTLGAAIRCEESMLVDGEVRYVYVNRGSREKAPIPQRIRKGLEPYVRANPEPD